MREGDTVHLAVVVCGEERVEETLNMVKSALLFTRSPVFLHIFCDPELILTFTTVVRTVDDKSDSFSSSVVLLIR